MLLESTEEVGKYTIGIFFDDDGAEDPRTMFDMLGDWEEFQGHTADLLGNLAYKLIDHGYKAPKGWIRKASRDEKGWQVGHDFDTCSEVVQNYLMSEFERRYVVNAVGYLHRDDRRRTVNYCSMEDGRKEWPKLRGTALRAKLAATLAAEAELTRAWAHGFVFGWAVALTEEVEVTRNGTKAFDVLASCGGYYGFGEWAYMLTEAREAARGLIEVDKRQAEAEKLRAIYDSGNGD